MFNVNRLRIFVREHWLASVIALVVGLVSCLPQIFFIAQLGSAYQGIHFFATPNEEAYLAIIQEVIDGHPLVASMPFFEYKNQLPLLPPTMAYGYALVSIFFHLSLAATLILSKFFLPALLFFIIYWFLLKLLDSKDAKIAQLTAVAGGLLVTLGFDLVDYRSIINFLTTTNRPDGFLIWTRPLNPISGALLLFIFLIHLLQFLKNKKISFKTIFFPALCLGLMMASYFFSWSLALSVLGVLGLFALARNDWQFVRYACLVVSGALIISAPYWWVVIKASALPWYTEASARIGLMSTRAPHGNKFLTLMLLWFVSLSVWEYWKNDRALFKKDWWQFCLALLGAGFLVYNQQVITGREIWYYHYVFYTIPFGFVVFLSTGFFIIKPRFKKTWSIGLLGLGLSALALGIFIQVGAYRSQFSHYKKFQTNQIVFNYLNAEAPKDCVVLVNDTKEFISTYISAFTHCNTYVSGERFVIAPPDRFIHNYLVLLRLRGISVNDIDAYLVEHKDEAQGFLYYQLQSALGSSDPEFEKVYKQLPEKYKEFVKQDFTLELKKYKIDYVFSPTSLNDKVKNELGLAKNLIDESYGFLYLVKTGQ